MIDGVALTEINFDDLLFPPEEKIAAPAFPPFDEDGSIAAADEAEKEAAAAEKEAEEQAKHDAFERRRAAAQEKVRREREEAEIGGTLSGDAQTFLDLRLRPGLKEASDFEPAVVVPVVQGLFNRDTLSWCAGPSGTFKSFVTADLAFRYGSEDMDYHGRKMTHGRALIVVAEGAAGYAHRKTAWEKQYDRQVKNVVIYPAPLQLGDVVKEMPALIKYLREEEEAGNGFGLIIFDTQAMCTVGVDENKSEMNLVINVMHRIREVGGACVLTVHHFGKKESNGMRGSSMLYAAADTVLILKRKDDAMDVALSTAQSDEGKQKDTGGEKDFLTLEMKFHEVGIDYFGDPVSSLVPVPSQGGSTDVSDVPDEAAQELPSLTPLLMFYLRAIGTYEEGGATPSALLERITAPEYPERPPGDHKIQRQTPSNMMQALSKKGKRCTEPAPGKKGGWRITPIGEAVIARALMDHDSTAQRFAVPPRKRRVQGTVHDAPELSP